jgi:hypothetical protein
VIDSASAVFMSLQNVDLCEHLNSPNARIGMLVRPKWLRDTALIGLRRSDAEHHECEATHSINLTSLKRFLLQLRHLSVKMVDIVMTS